MKMAQEGNIGAGFEFLERAVDACANIAISNNGGARVDENFTQFELDSFNLNAMSKIVMGWEPAGIAAYRERIQKLATTEAGKQRPMILFRCTYICDLFPALCSGDANSYAAWNWTMTKMSVNMCDENSDANSRLTQEERQLVRPMPLVTICLGGDAMIRTPSFTWDCFGPNGDKLVEWANAYVYEEHHAFIADMFSGDFCIISGGADWLLTLQFGRVSDALPIMEARLNAVEKVVSDTSSPSRMFDLPAAANLFVILHITGQSQMVRKFCKVLGYTFDTVSKTLSELTEPVAFYTSMDHKGAGGGVLSLKRLCWQIKCFLIMHAAVSSAKAIAWLESLPDDEGFIEVSMTMPTHDHGCLIGVSHQTCWLALAHEKVGLNGGALRFCRLALEPDLMKAGVPSNKWARTIALACKGRVLAKLKRHDEALIAFQAAISTSLESYSMMEAFAYRELANVDVTAGTPATVVEAAAQARHNLEEKLKEFDGRLTHAEFDTLSIAP